MLSLREKLTLQKTIDAGLERLNTGIASLRERLSVQKEVDAGLARLNGDSAPSDTLLDRFIAGEFTKAGPQKMWSVFNEVLALAKGSLDMLKDALLKFFEYHESQGAGMVMESANVLPYDYGFGENNQQIARLLAMLQMGQDCRITIRR